MSLNVDLNELLQQLPDLISWVVPGLLFMFTFQHFKYEERSYRKESISILNAVCISFFIRYAVIIVFSRLSGDWLWGVDGSVWIAICSCVVAFLFGALIGWISNLSATKKFSEEYLHLTIDSNPYYDLADKKNGCYIRVKPKQKEYYFFGIYSNCYNRDNEDWIVVKNAIRIDRAFNTKEEENYRASQTQRAAMPTAKMLINAKELDIIEFIYTQNRH